MIRGVEMLVAFLPERSLIWSVRMGGVARAHGQSCVLTHRPGAIGRGKDIDVRLLDEHGVNSTRLDNSICFQGINAWD